MSNKRAVLFAGILFSIVLISFLVSAQTPTEDLKKLIGGTKEVLTSFFEAILGPGPTGTMAGSEMSFLSARALFLLIMFVIVWAVISKIPIFSSSTWMVVIISGAVSILSTKFLLQASWVQTILLPYSVLGIAVTAFLPLLIYFYFVESAINSKSLRKVAWILAAIVFIGLWWSRYSEIKGSAIYIYPITALACLVAFWADGTIQKQLANMKTQRELSIHHLVQAGKAKEKAEELIKISAQFRPGSSEYKEIQDKLRELEQRAAEQQAAAKGVKGKKH